MAVDWQTKFTQYYREYETFKSDTTDDEIKTYHSMLVDALLDWQEKEKTRRGGVLDEDVPEDVRRSQLRRIIRDLDIPPQYHTTVINRVLDYQYRMGPVQSLWEKPMVSDIQIFIPVNDQYPQIITYTERGKRQLFSGPGFRDYDDAREWVNTHLSRIGLRYDPAEVQLDGMLPGGERVHVISGPVGYSMLTKEKDGNSTYTFVRAMIITIRRFVASFTLEQLTETSKGSYKAPSLPKEAKQMNVKYQRKILYTPHTGGLAGQAMADQATMDFLRIMVEIGKNHIVSGGTGVGKTTLANALTAAIPESEVLLVLEEAPEMQPQKEKNVIRIYERKAVNGAKGFTLADGMKAALRMFPDRIFVAELRDSIAYVFLQAIQSGHDGSSTTVHASSCAAAIERVVSLASDHPSAPSQQTIREILFDRIDTVLHGSRVGSLRFFDEIVQLQPGGKMHKVMEYKQQGVTKDGKPIGYFVFYGPTDEFVQEMLRKGIEIPESWGWETVEEKEEVKKNTNGSEKQ